MLILASQSPRRAELLRNAGYAFEVRPADVDEQLRAGEPAEEYVKRLAREKALAVLATAPAGAVVLGADTTVVLKGECLGKPVDAADAQQMLARLSGRAHQVMTGVCVAWRKAAGAAAEVDAEVYVEVGVEVTEVKFAAMSGAEIAAYVATGEPMDKAGAYAIQGVASRWIPRIRGCYFNVVGLPVARVSAMLVKARVPRL
jgi:septum formation protein